MKNIAGVIVLYNPTKEVIDNINSYINEISILYVVDNSENIKEEIIELIKSISKVKYISNKENVGIAKALNIGAENAIKDGFEWLLTMDQDSKATPNMVSKMYEYTKSLNGNEIGILSPFHASKTEPCCKSEYEYEEMSRVMTSGNLLNLQIYKVIGGFIEELFIDYVDVEYCLRLNQNGYKIIRLNKIILEHNLGNISKVLNFEITNHSPIRRYYYIRNRLYVTKKYKSVFPKFYLQDRLHLTKECIKIILFEKKKWLNLKNMTKGLLDYKRNKLGRL